MSAPKGRDADERESDGGDMAPDYYREGGFVITRVLIGL